MESAGKLFMGCSFLIVGVGVGYWMNLEPEGLNPQWGLWAAELFPVAFVLCGVFLIADAFGCSRFAIRILQILVVGLVVLLHWIAYFARGGECTASVAFLGVPLLGWRPDLRACEFTVLVIVMALDASAIALAARYGWRWWRNRRDGSRMT